MAEIKDAYEFLSLLRDNNNREWFNVHKTEYLEICQLFNSITERLISEIGKFDKDIYESHLKVSDCTYRIYRDIRFSKDKSPYKTHIGIYICKGGKKSSYAGYYFHFEPPVSDDGEINAFGFTKGSILCSGLYLPDTKIIKSLRDEISVNGDSFIKAIKQAKGFDLDTYSSLKKVPNGFSAEKKEWEDLLKLRDFTITAHIGTDFLFAPDIVERIASQFKKTHKFVEILNKAVQYASDEM